MLLCLRPPPPPSLTPPAFAAPPAAPRVRALLPPPGQAIKPDLVINAGTAGGFQKHDTAIGDVFISSRVKNHDRR